MPSVVYSPFFPFVENLNEFVNELDQRQRTCGKGACEQPEAKKAHKDQTFTPELDVYETPDTYLVQVNLPGANKEEIAIDFDTYRRQLVITGEVKRTVDEETAKHVRVANRNVGKFSARVRLDNKAGVDLDFITAKYELGVLEVKVPKSKEQPKLSVQIE